MKNILIFLAVSFSSISFAQYPTDSLFAYYAFDQNVLVDDGPNQLNGNSFNSTFKDYNGRKNGSHEFNGVDSYIELFDDNFETFTINIWFKTKIFDQSKTQRIFHKGDRGGSSNYQLSYSGLYVNGKFRFTIANYNATNALALFSDNIDEPDKWHMITCVFNNKTLQGKLYLDAVLQDSGFSDNPMIPTPEPLKLSYYPLANNEQIIDGELDELGFWTRVLSQKEIDELFEIPNCDNKTYNDTITYFVSSSEFEALSPLIKFNTTDSLISIQKCDSVINRFSRFEYNPNFCKDTLVVYDTIPVIDTLIYVDTNTFYVYDTLVLIDTVYYVDTTYLGVEDTLNIYLNVTGVANNVYENEVLVYPNPAHNILKMNFGDYVKIGNFKVIITDVNGIQKWSTNVTRQNAEVNISNYARGLYFMRILDSKGKEVVVKKIVLK